MKKVGIAALKSHLSDHLRQVRRGHVVTVLDRDTPVAQIVPYPSAAGPLTVRHPRHDGPRLHEIGLPPRLKVREDVVALLLEERQSGR
jgi:prevent-host-death family protein